MELATEVETKSVLIFEDDGVIAEDLQATLMALGYDAFAIAATAEEAMDCAARRRPDVVLMDVHTESLLQLVQEMVDGVT